MSCDESRNINTSKNTFYDDISDITYLSEYFYTTNYDLSGNAGSQIDLLKFLISNDSTIILEDSYDLGMNGQGYFAITNDGENLYLQSRSTGGVLKLSSVGEWGFFEIDLVASNWQSSGIAYDSDKDSLILFYRNLGDRTQYRARTVAKDKILNSENDVTLVGTCAGPFIVGPITAPPIPAIAPGKKLLSISLVNTPGDIYSAIQFLL